MSFGRLRPLCVVLSFLLATVPSAQFPVPTRSGGRVGTISRAIDGVHRVHCADPAFRPQLEVLAAGLKRLGVDRVEITDQEAPVRFKRGYLAPGLTYRMRPLDGVLMVTVEEPVGAAYAVSTLLQRVQVEDGIAIWPGSMIDDGPGLPYRSFMVDMGRNPHRPETLRQVVDMLAFFKGNYLHLHLADDQLFSWPSRAFPRLTSKNAGWTWSDFVELEAYSQARGVTVIPELDVPGHSTILRRTYPEVFGVETRDLATSPDAQKGVETLLDEMMEVFQASPYVHIGGDEAYSVPEDVQRDFINRLDAFVRSKGRRTIVWEGPRLGTGENKVHTSVIHMNWRTVNVSAQEMLDAGYEVINAAWDPLYVVDHYPRTMFTAVDLERCYDWKPTSFAHVNHEIATFAAPHRARTADGILGFCMPWWEGREENLIPLCLPRFAVVASVAWNRSAWTGKQNRDFGAFLRSLASAQARFEELSGVRIPVMPVADAATQAENHAYLGSVSPSRGASQPHFGPARLTNGITDRFDHFLGFPTKPDPLEIVIELREPAKVGRVVVHETAVGRSHEVYELEVSSDGTEYERVGSSGKSTRGDASYVEHRFEPRVIGFIRIRTSGCEGLTFPSFSRLTEVAAFEE